MQTGGNFQDTSGLELSVFVARLYFSGLILITWKEQLYLPLQEAQMFLQPHHIYSISKLQTRTLVAQTTGPLQPWRSFILQMDFSVLLWSAGIMNWADRCVTKAQCQRDAVAGHWSSSAWRDCKRSSGASQSVSLMFFKAQMSTEEHKYTNKWMFRAAKSCHIKV